MRNSRYKKLPGVDHGSANDSPAKYLDNTINDVDQGIAQIGLGGSANMNSNAMGTPMVKLGADLAKMNEIAEKLEEGGLSREQAINIAETEVTGMPKKGYYRK